MRLEVEVCLLLLEDYCVEKRYVLNDQFPEIRNNNPPILQKWTPKFIVIDEDMTFTPDDNDTDYLKKIVFTASTPLTLRLNATATKGDLDRLYYEVKIIKKGQLVVGWADCEAEDDLGSDEHSWAFGSAIKIHEDLKTHWGKVFNEGDIIGCAIDFTNNSISYSLNGDWEEPMGVAFRDVEFVGGLAHAITGSYPSSVEVNFKQLVHTPPGDEYYQTYDDLIDFVTNSIECAKNAFEPEEEEEQQQQQQE